MRDKEKGEKYRRVARAREVTSAASGTQFSFSVVEISVSILKILPGIDMEERASKSNTCVMCKTADSHAEQGQNTKTRLKEGRAVIPSF